MHTHTCIHTHTHTHTFIILYINISTNIYIRMIIDESSAMWRMSFIKSISLSPASHSKHDFDAFLYDVRHGKQLIDSTSLVYVCSGQPKQDDEPKQNRNYIRIYWNTYTSIYVCVVLNNDILSFRKLFSKLCSCLWSWMNVDLVKSECGWVNNNFELNSSSSSSSSTCTYQYYL